MATMVARTRMFYVIRTLSRFLLIIFSVYKIGFVHGMVKLSHHRPDRPLGIPEVKAPEFLRLLAL